MFSLAQFKSVFKIRDSEGQPYILIGGQAVNFWATRYISVELEWQPDFRFPVEKAPKISRK